MLVWGKDYLNYLYYNFVNKFIKWIIIRKLVIFISVKIYIMLVCKLYLIIVNNFILSNLYYFCNLLFMELLDSKIIIYKMKINYFDCFWKYEYCVNKFF